MNKLILILLGGGIPTVILINIFRGFFTKAFRFIAAVVWVGIAAAAVCFFLKFITMRELLNVLIVFGVPLFLINKLIV